MLQLPHQFIVHGTEIVMLDSLLLAQGKDYLFNERFGVVTLRGENVHRLFTNPPSVHRLVIHYQALPLTFKESYQHRAPVAHADTLTGKRAVVAKTSSGFSLDDLFSSNLQKSGSLVRGFTIGSNRDLTLSSGFRMQMSGRIADDVEITAALTDENSPIQPEGTTQTLQEIDKVFIEIRSTDVGATLGDFNFDLTGNEFGGVSRKLQGAEGNANYRVGDANGNIMFSGATARGKFTTNQFQGVDGIQGPYLLIGANNERSIIVIAGTERVYVNGDRMNRGEINDYVIDYGNGELTFTSRRFITAASRITVDFEYTDRQFNRTFIAGKTGNRFLNNRLAISATFMREGDDENSPVDVQLSDADKTILRSAGDDRFKASTSGIEFVGAGKGQYVKKDTIINTSSSQDTVTFYFFSPEDTINALYSITFSYVGSGNGDYNKVSLGRYQFVGRKQGSYAPIRFLPMPQSHSLTDVDLKTHVADDLNIIGEFALSNFDANLFSSIGDENNSGSAVKFGLEFNPSNLQFGGKNIGALDLQLKERFIDRKFVPIDRTNEVEFNRKWNIVDSSSVDEELREGSLTYNPVQKLSVGGGLGWIKRGDAFSTNRYTSSIHYFPDSLPRVNYDLEVINNRYTVNDLTANWIRQKAGTEYAIGILLPGVRYEGEVLKNNSIVNDTLKQGSFRFNEFLPGLALNNLFSMSLKTEFGWRWEDSLLAGRLQRASRTFTQRYNWQLQEWNSLSSSFDITVSKRAFTESFHQRKDDDVQTILFRSQTRYNPWNRGLESDWFYEVTTERSAKLERVFQRVPKGTGNYIYAGDINDNHIVDEGDFRLTRFDGDYIVLTVPTDQLVPVINLKASSRIRLNFSRIIPSGSWYGTLCSAVSSETYLRVEEKSSESNLQEIYFLHFNHFLNDRTTIAGNNLISQDVYLFENNPEFSSRFRFAQRRGLTQFALENERLYNVERSVRIRWQFVREIANEINFINKNDNLTAFQLSNRERGIISNSLSFDWFYRPEQYIELAFGVGTGRASNFDTTVADLNNQSIRMTYSLEQKGQAKAELIREEVSLNKGGVILPFELTDGKVEGKTWRWQAGVDYRVTQFIQATVGYEGRSEGGSQPIHTAKAEVRAFF